MTSLKDNYQLLIKKLDEFIRKYYVNQLLRGLIYTAALLLAAFVVINVLEYFFYFSSAVRSVLFFGFIGGALFTLIRWIVIPLMHYFRLGKVISNEKAAAIIGTHFQNVQDRLLNILQLRLQLDAAAESSLIEASINQKIAALKPIPFSSAINLSLNRRHLKYLILPASVLVFILFASPDIIRQGTFRLLHHSEYFEKQAPFQFEVSNKKLQTVQYQDFEINISVKGNLLPGDAFIHVNGFDYPLTKKSAAEFTYNFVKPQKDMSFYFSANGFRSKDFLLTVLPKPIIVKFTTGMNYPAYLGKKMETLQNIGDLTVPEGTSINWNFVSENTSAITIAFSDSFQTELKSENNRFEFSRKMKRDAPYTIYVSGEQLPKADSIRYAITVIPDRYPTINVSQVNDSTNQKYLYFIGESSDDYGLKNLYLKYRIKKEGDEQEGNLESFPVVIAPGKYSQFSHFWDLNSIQLSPGDQIIYFFEVWDNDGVNGSKSSRSQFMTFNMPSGQEMENKTEENNEQIKKDLEDAMKEAQDIRDEYEKMQNELLNKKNPSWEDKKKIDDLLQRQTDLNKQIEQIQNTFKENLNNQKDYKKYDEGLKKKQEGLQKLMDEMLTPEMKEMMKKLQEMLEQLNKDKTLDELQNQKLSNEELQKELDRMLALFKKLEFEQKMKDTKEKLEQLAQKQEELSKETSEKKKENDSLSQEQSDIQKEFDEIQKDLEKLNEMNKDLDHPNEMPDLNEEQEQTDQEMNDAQQNLQKSSNQKAGQNQKNASQQMKDMAQQMGDAMMSMEMQQMELDMQAIRQILENLITVSFEQEDLVNKTKGVNIYNPQYLQLMKDQKDVQDDLKMIEDSVQALAKKVFQIQSFVNEQFTDISKNMEQGLLYLEQRQPGMAASNQQFIMTAVNNLALMFEETMQQMQQQMSNSIPGNQMCNKPGGAKPNMGSLKGMQKQLNDKIQQMGEQMKNGKIPSSGQGMSKELAEMAAQQAAIREALRQMNEELNSDGQNKLGDLGNLQKEMEKTETELLNKQITAEMLKRQQEILTRLLEAENAERQRETDEKRESNTGKEMVKPLPPEIEEYLKQKQAELELFKTVPPDLKPFYRDLVEEYYKSLQQR